jgi:hypothetical protein
MTVVTAGSMKLAEHRPAAIQVVFKTDKMFWVTKPIILRNVPVTAVRPTPRLAEWRYIFATRASEWRGATGVGTLKQDSRSKKHKAGDTVLAVQAKAQEVLKAAAKALTKSRAPTYDDKAKKYRSYVRYRIHTVEELVRLAGITPPAPAKE